jgi:uncharacterized sporulation protein YeaH/YhbH (DUF444 family)
MEIVDKEFHPNTWNIYTFYCGDGENWSSDNKKAVDEFKKIKDVSQLVGYCEINEHYEGLTDADMNDHTNPNHPWANFSAWKDENLENLWSRLTPICDTKFKKIMIGQKEHIWGAFNTLFGGKST